MRKGCYTCSRWRKGATLAEMGLFFTGSKGEMEKLNKIKKRIDEEKASTNKKSKCVPIVQH